MAQKPNFLKKLISTGLVGMSTAAFIAGASTTALGANQNIGADVDLEQAGIAGIATGDSLTYTVVGGGPFTATATGGADANGAPTVLFGSINMLQAGNFVVDGANITIGSVGSTTNNAGLLTVTIDSANTLTLNGAAGLAPFAINTYDNLGAVDFADPGAVFKVSLAGGTRTAIFTNATTFNSSGAAGRGTITIDAANIVTFDGTIGNTQGIRSMILTGNAQVNLNANAKFDGAVGVGGIGLGNGSILNVANGVDIIGVTGARNIVIYGAAAGNGTVNFLGNSTVSTDIGVVGGNEVSVVNVSGELTFQGGNNGGGSNFAANTINLTGAASLIKFTTQNHRVTGNILNTSGTNNQGGFSVNGGNVTIFGNVGAAGASLGAISFETDNVLEINQSGAGLTKALFVQEVNTYQSSKGTLGLRGANYSIYGNIGANNPLKIVALLDDGTIGANATNFTLTKGSSINAQIILLADTKNNTLILEEGTTVTGNIVNNLAAGNGTITLTGNATIIGDIGVTGGNAINAINLGSKNLSYGGKTISVGGATTFAADEKLILTNTSDPIIINSVITVTTDQKGTIDASALTNSQTLTMYGGIGTIAAKNVTLGQLNVGSSKTILFGDAAINELVIGDGGSVQLSNISYIITKTTNANNQGKIIFNGSINLLAGSLGSAANALAEINFTAPVAPAVDNILTVGKNVNLYADIITTAVNNIGSFNFNAGGTNIVSGIVGTGANKFNTVSVSNGTTAQFAGDAIFSGATTLAGNSTLQIGGNYTAAFITGAAPNDTGILQFINTKDITVTLTKQAGAINPLTQVQVSGSGNVAFNQVAGAGNAANNAVEASTIAFTGNSLGAKLFLASGIPLDGLIITSTVGNKGDAYPAVIVSNVDSTIANGAAIGDQKNIIGLGLATDNKITVEATTLYAGFATINDNQGTIILSGGTATTAGTVYSLGTGNKNPKLKLVTVTTNYKNLGDTNVTNLVVNDGLTYTAGDGTGTDFSGQITLGSANGNSNVIFANNTNSDSASMIATAKANNGTVTYQGGAYVGNIGSTSTPVASVQFAGPAGSEAGLQGAIYSTTTNFGSYDLYITTKNVVLGGGTSAINGQIDLDTNTLTFDSGTSTWGSNTSLVTDLVLAANGSNVLGQIIINENAQINATATTPITVNVRDSANANFVDTQTYTLIKGGTRFSGNFGTPEFKVTGSNRFVVYGLVQNSSGDYVLTRTNDAVNVLARDIKSSPFANVPEIARNIAALLDPKNTGNARAAYENLLLAKTAKDAAAFTGALTTDTSAATTNANLDGAKNIQTQLGNRVNAVRYLGAPNGARENMLSAPEAGAPVAAGDEAVDNVAYGAWAKPFYTEAHQSAKGGVAGYKAKTTGIVIGLDTMANDNLMVGAAIGITKTDIKHQNYKKGDKTDVNGFSFSLYGAQQLVSDLFVQGNAIFSVNQVKNKSQRYIFDNNGNMSKQIAAGNYDNMTFGGNVMLGYDANVMEGVLLTPMAGLNYLKSSDENYKETGTTFANKQVNSKFGDRTDLIAGAKVMGSTLNVSDFAVYPEAHAFVVHKINGKLSKVQSQLDGQATPFISQPDRTAKTSYNLGLSLTARPDAKMEYGIGYDANIASKYIAHQGSIKVRVNF